MQPIAYSLFALLFILPQVESKAENEGNAHKPPQVLSKFVESAEGKERIRVFGKLSCYLPAKPNAVVDAQIDLWDWNVFRDDLLGQNKSDAAGNYDVGGSGPGGSKGDLQPYVIYTHSCCPDQQQCCQHRVPLQPLGVDQSREDEINLAIGNDDLSAFEHHPWFSHYC